MEKIVFIALLLILEGATIETVLVKCSINLLFKGSSFATIMIWPYPDDSLSDFHSDDTLIKNFWGARSPREQRVSLQGYTWSDAKSHVRLVQSCNNKELD